LLEPDDKLFHLDYQNEEASLDEGYWVQPEEGNQNLDRDREVHSNSTALAAEKLQGLEKESDLHKEAGAGLESHEKNRTAFLGEAEEEEQPAC
jgi:hypothetical protein